MESQKFNRLLRKIKSDKRALEKIYEHYLPKIIFHVRRRFGDLISPEDVTHDVFISLLTVELTEPIEHPTAWLYKLVDNKAKDILKVRHEEVPLSEILTIPFDIDLTLLQEDVKRAFKYLDPLSQQILYLHHWEGYGYGEIADELHLSEGNIRVKASRAYKILKKYL